MKDDKNVHAGHRNRLRNLFRNGDLSKLEDYQLLEFLLTYSIPRKDTNVIAHNLIEQFGSFTAVLDTKPEYLMKVKGIGESSAVFLHDLSLIFNEYKLRKSTKKEVFKTYVEAVEYCIKLMQHRVNEEIFLVMLDNKYGLINTVRVAQGTVNKAHTSTREITEIALKNNASFVLLTHNHPDGGSAPSDKDDNFTRSVVLSMTLNGVGVVDHIIVGADGSFYSYRDHDRIEKYKEELQPKNKIVTLK